MNKKNVIVRGVSMIVVSLLLLAIIVSSGGFNSVTLPVDDNAVEDIESNVESTQDVISSESTLSGVEGNYIVVTSKDGSQARVTLATARIITTETHSMELDCYVEQRRALAAYISSQSDKTAYVISSDSTTDAFIYTEDSDVSLAHQLVSQGYATAVFSESLAEEDVRSLSELQNTAREEQKGFWKCIDS